MKSNMAKVPFGILFEESAKVIEDLPEPIYDEEKDMSYVIGQTNERVPVVSLESLLETETETFIQREQADKDEPSFSHLMATKTVTEIRSETSDEDPDARSLMEFSLRTRTTTAIKSEETDEDVSNRHHHINSISIMRTSTATKIYREDTDED